MMLRNARWERRGSVVVVCVFLIFCFHYINGNFMRSFSHAMYLKILLDEVESAG